VIVFEADTPPDVPVIVSVVLLRVAAPVTGVIVSLVDPLVVTLVGLNDAFTSVGRPDTVKLTEPVKPFAGVTVIVSVPTVAGKQKNKTQYGGVTVTMAVLAASVNVPLDTLKLCVTVGAAA
jgi:hypothetical protein